MMVFIAFQNSSKILVSTLFFNCPYLDIWWFMNVGTWFFEPNLSIFGNRIGALDSWKDFEYCLILFSIGFIVKNLSLYCLLWNSIMFNRFNLRFSHCNFEPFILSMGFCFVYRYLIGMGICLYRFHSLSFCLVSLFSLGFPILWFLLSVCFLLFFAWMNSEIPLCIGLFGFFRFFPGF